MESIVRSTALFLLFGFFYSCSPQVAKITKTYPALNEKDSVMIICIGDKIGFPYEKLGTLRIGDNGSGIDCDCNAQLNRLKIEARKVGGNAIKIVKHIPPHWGTRNWTSSRWESKYYSCHEFLIEVLRRE